MDLTYSMRLGEKPRLAEQDEAAVQKFRYECISYPEGQPDRAWTCLRGWDWLQGWAWGGWVL